MTATHRVIRAVRHVNDELLRASEAIIRSARAPQPRPPHLRPRTPKLTRAPPVNALAGPPDPGPAVSRRQQRRLPATRWAPSRAGV